MRMAGQPPRVRKGYQHMKLIAAGKRPCPFRLHRECAAVCISALLLVAPLWAQDSQEKVVVDDVSRTFMVHLPIGYDSQQHYPVVILLHGRNQDADDMARLTHFNQLADKNGIVAVYPQATRGEWNIGVRPEQPEMAMGPRGGGRRGGWGGYPGGGGGYPGGGGGYPGGGRRGGQTPDENGVDGKKIMAQIAERTGGHAYDAKKKEDLEPIYNQISEELHSLYLLTYTPDKPDTEGGFH